MKEPNLEKSFKITILAEYNEIDKDLPNASGFAFTLPQNMPYAEFFFDKKGTLSKNGAVFVNRLLVEALSGNIHATQQRGLIDKSEQIESSIQYLRMLLDGNCETKVFSVRNVFSGEAFKKKG